MPALILGSKAPLEAGRKRGSAIPLSIKEPLINTTTPRCCHRPSPAELRVRCLLPHTPGTSEGQGKQSRRRSPSKHSMRRGSSSQGSALVGHNPKLPPMLLLLGSSSFPCRVPQGLETLSHHLLRHSHTPRDPPDTGLVSSLCPGVKK